MSIFKWITNVVQDLLGKKAASSPLIVSVINESTILSPAQVTAAVNALQLQVNQDFGPIWDTYATLQIHTPLSAPHNSYWLVLLDNSDQAGALGYHDLTPQGLPLAKVFAQTDHDYNLSWTVTASHELLEMLADPYIQTVMDVSDGTTDSFYALEVGDPVEDDSLGYVLLGQLMSDFITPAWFGNTPGYGTWAGKFDFRGHLHQPLDVATNGYALVYSGGQWGTIGMDKQPVNTPEALADARSRNQLRNKSTLVRSVPRQVTPVS